MALTLASSGQGGVFTVRAGSFGGRLQAGVTPIVSLLLDTYPDAAAAYSLRKLRTAYTGAAIRVRRSSDNTETDIGFISNQLDTAAITTFVGAGNGFVTTWYDQSGNTRNAVQATSGNQPQIFNAGNVILQGTKPTLLFDGINDYIDASGVTTGYPKTIFLISKFTSILASEIAIFDSVTTNQAIFYKDSFNRMIIGFGIQGDTSYTITTNFNLYSIFNKNTGPNFYVNSTLLLNNPNFGSNSFNGLRIGAARGSAGLFYNGNIGEFIVYGSDQAANRTAIEANINSYYSIY
jgi:hypothetical protein